MLNLVLMAVAAMRAMEILLPAALQAAGHPHIGCKVTGSAFFALIAAGGGAVLSFRAVLRGSCRDVTGGQVLFIYFYELQDLLS